tara:strand:+ start:8838 stop:9326 length:489 start_codon:yes stop_codon:yes gene_type:complete
MALDMRVDQLVEPDPDDWVIYECPADGNCFYHTVCAFFDIDECDTVRKDILNYIDNVQYNIPQIDVVIERVSNGMTENYVDGNVSAESWANHEEIQIVSRMYDICIVIWNAQYHMWTATFPEDDMLDLRECENVMYLYHNGSHFSVMVPKKKKKIMKKSVSR